MFIPKGLPYFKTWKKMDKYERALYLFLAIEFINSPLFLSVKDIMRDFGFSDKIIKETLTGLIEKGMLVMGHTFRDNTYKVIPFWSQHAEDKSYFEDTTKIDIAKSEYQRNPTLKSKTEKRQNRIERSIKNELSDIN